MKLSRLLELLERLQETTSYNPDVIVMIFGDGYVDSIKLDVIHNVVEISAHQENEDVQSNN